MQSSHTLDQLDICFDDTHAIAEVVPRLVDLEVAVPHLSPAFW
jgi:hypothetical protein